MSLTRRSFAATRTFAAFLLDLWELDMEPAKSFRERDKRFDAQRTQGLQISIPGVFRDGQK